VVLSRCPAPASAGAPPLKTKKAKQMSIKTLVKKNNLNSLWSDLLSAPRSELRSTLVLVILILLVPAAITMLNGADSQTTTFTMVMFSGPIALGLMAQRMKGRTGVWWWLLSLVAMCVVNVLAGGGGTPNVLAHVIVLGALPMAIIIATLPRR
jgi:hypothetical protein